MSKDPKTSGALSLVVDEGPGLKIANWTNRGKDMLQSFAIINCDEPPENATNIDARIYPVGIDNRWRVTFEQPEVTGTEGSIMGKTCMTWRKVDEPTWGGVPMDEFDFQVGSDGVEGVDIIGLRTKLSKV